MDLPEFDPSIPGTFHLAEGLFFRRVERRCGVDGENGGANGNRKQPGIWWDVEMTKCVFNPTTKKYMVIAQQRIDEGSWLSVVSSMGAGGETTQTYGIALALHRAGNIS